MYGENLHGEKLYGEDGNSRSSIDKKRYELNIFNQLPPGLYKDSKDTTNMAEISTYETTINKILNDIDSLEDEVTFVNAKNIGIARKEDVYGIKTNNSRFIEYRKSTVISKARGVGVITKQAIENMAAAYSNGEVEVIEIEDAYIIIKFIGVKGIPPNLDDLINILEYMLPAHVIYKLEFILITYGMLKNNLKVTHGELKNNGITYRRVKEYRVDEINEDEVI